MQLFGGDWTEQKLAILMQYLQRYNTALKNQPFTRVYVDAFAGTGYRMRRRQEYKVPDLFEEVDEHDPQELLKGSARLALEVEPAFHRYIFVESDAAKIAELEKLRDEHPARAKSVDIVQSDANEFIRCYCASQDWQGQRAVMFLDPFATEVSWNTVERIAQTKAIDMWLLFPLMAVNRLLANDPQKACRDRLDKVFGTHEWFERFYRGHHVEDIFGQPLYVVKRSCDYDSIGAFFGERLQSIFAGVCSKGGILRNTKDTPLFQFFFAAANAKGAPIALRIAENLLRRL
jgi:three-Cys-motif partner protein